MRAALVARSWVPWLCLALTALAGCANPLVCRTLFPLPSDPPDAVLWESCPLLEDGTVIGIAVSQSPRNNERGSRVLLSPEELVVVADRALGRRPGIGSLLAGETICLYLFGSCDQIRVYEHAAIRAWWVREARDGHNAVRGVTRFEIFPFRTVCGVRDTGGGTVREADGASLSGPMALFSMDQIENNMSPSGKVTFIRIDGNRYIVALPEVSMNRPGQVHQQRVAGPFHHGFGNKRLPRSGKGDDAGTQ